MVLRPGSLLVFWLLAAAPGLRADERVLAAFPREEVPISRWLEANGWTSKRDDPGRWSVGEGVLNMVSENDSVLIGTERGFPLDPRVWSKLRFRFRVYKAPAGTDLSRKSGDDAAFRVYVGFDRGGGLFSPPNTIAYAWTENLEPGTVVRSAYGKRLNYLSVGKGPDSGGWVEIERDLSADYTRVFPEDAKGLPSVKAILVKCDTNNTGAAARAALSGISLGTE